MDKRTTTREGQVQDIEVASHSGGTVNNPTTSGLTVQHLEGEPLEANEIQVPISVLL